MGEFLDESKCPFQPDLEGLEGLYEASGVKINFVTVKGGHWTPSFLRNAGDDFPGSYVVDRTEVKLLDSFKSPSSRLPVPRVSYYINRDGSVDATRIGDLKEQLLPSKKPLPTTTSAKIHSEWNLSGLSTTLTFLEIDDQSLPVEEDSKLPYLPEIPLHLTPLSSLSFALKGSLRLRHTDSPRIPLDEYPDYISKRLLTGEILPTKQIFIFKEKNYPKKNHPKGKGSFEKIRNHKSDPNFS